VFSLSQSVGYGVLALSRMDPEGNRLVMVGDIAADANIPKPYLVKILTRLQAAGIVEGKRGQKGGLRLTRPAKAISVFDLVQAIDGPEWKDRCLLGLPCCSGDNPCPLHDYWVTVKPEIEQKLRGLSLDQARTFADAGWKFQLPAG